MNMAILLALLAAIAIASICQAAPVSDPHHTLYRHSASGPLSNNRQSQFEVNLPFLRVSGQHNYPYGYHPVQVPIVPFQPQPQQQQQRWLPSKLPFSRFNPASAIPPLCLPCSNTTSPFANQRSPQNRLFFPSISFNAPASNTNNQGPFSAMDWINWWNPFGLVPQLPTLPYWTNIFCCNSNNNTSTTTTTTTTTTIATSPTTTVPSTTTTVTPTTSSLTTVNPPFPTIFPPTTTTTLIPPTTTTLIPPTTTTAIPPTTTTLIPPTTTTLVPPTTTLVPPTTTTTLVPPTTTTTLVPPTTTTTLVPPTTTTTLVPPTTTTTLVPPTTTTTLAPPPTTTTLVPPTTTTTVAPPTTTAPPERSFESGTNKESLPTDTIPLSGLKLLMNLFPPSYISFVRR